MLNNLIISIFYYFNLIKIFFTTKDNWEKINKADILLLRHDVDCGIMYNNKKYSTLVNSIEYLYNRCGYTCVTVAKPYSKDIQNSFSEIYSINRTYFVFTLFEKLFNKNKKINLWIKILKKSQIKVVIGIQPDLYLCKACIEIEIPIYSLQHGAIESDIRCYTDIKYKKNNNYIQPTGFLVWDEDSLFTLKKSNLDITNSYIIGHPFIYRFIKQYNDDIYIKNLEEYSNIFEQNDKPNILITTQWGLKDYYNTEFDLLPRELIEVIKQTSGNYNYYIRLHPVNKAKQLNSICESLDINKYNINVKEVTEMPLPFVLKQISLHITFHSAVTKECCFFGINTLLLNQAIKDGGRLETLYLYERIKGYAKIIEIEQNIILDEISKNQKNVQENICFRTENVLMNLVDFNEKNF